MPINPSYANQPMFNNPYGGVSAPSMPSGGGGGGGWLGNALPGMAAGGAQGFMMGGPVGAAIGAGIPLLTGALGAIFGGDSEQDKAFKEAARIRGQRKQEMGAGQTAYQRQAAGLFPEMPKESFIYKNPVLDNAITNALMYRMGNLYSDWGMPEGRRIGGQDLRQQFLGGMNFANPYGAPPQAPAPQPDLTISPGAPESGWMEEFRGPHRPGRGQRGEYNRFAM